MRSLALLPALLALSSVAIAFSPASSQDRFVQVIRRNATDEVPQSGGLPDAERGCDEQGQDQGQAPMRGRKGHHGWWRHRNGQSPGPEQPGESDSANTTTTVPIATAEPDSPGSVGSDSSIGEASDALAGVQQNNAQQGGKVITRTRTHWFTYTRRPQAPPSSNSSPEVTKASSAPPQFVVTKETPTQHPTTKEPESEQPKPSPSSSLEPPPEPETPSSGGGQALGEWEQGILAAHNQARSTHSASALTWSQDMADTARAWAENCVWEHGQVSTSTRAGQNMAVAASSAAIASQSGEAIIKMFMDEEKDYNPDSPTYSHFTQVVWKGTSEVGCAQVQCPNASFKNGQGEQVFPNSQLKSTAFSVCNYQKPGNVIGQFADNVVKILQ